MTPAEKKLLLEVVSVVADGRKGQYYSNLEVSRNDGNTSVALWIHRTPDYEVVASGHVNRNSDKIEMFTMWLDFLNRKRWTFDKKTLAATGLE